MVVNGGPSFEKEAYQVPDGMPLSIFNDRYSRMNGGGELQTYEERIRQVVSGNFTLEQNPYELKNKTPTLQLALRGIMPFSGRHIQHGDLTQYDRDMEVFTNCSTAAFSFMSFLLLLNGSGVGRDYSSDSCRVNWDFVPNFRIVLSGGPEDDGDVQKGAHRDYNKAQYEFRGGFDSLREARHKYDSDSEETKWIVVKDSREGWAEVVAVLETAAFHKNHKNSLFIFDFSDIRPEGSPIAGMQGRKAQGPLPMMRALLKVATIKGAGMKAWKQALFIDHYLASCVVMGNVRRAARMATKHWRDRDVIEFIDIKRGGHLWTANNSITVDAEFWSEAANPRPSHARRVFEAAIGAAYFDKTGEPGFINVDRINGDTDGLSDISARNYIHSQDKLSLHVKTYDMIDNVLIALKKKKYPFITNPCGEIPLFMGGGYCVIGDVCLSKCDTLEEAEEAVALMAPFLIRVNRMKSLYESEVARTNRIGIGITGIHEFAWKHFECSFNDMILMEKPEKMNGEGGKVVKFWSFIDGLRTIAEKSAAKYSIDHGLTIPHTVTTIKPSGTISKVMNCTEGAHLPSMLYYLRWIIFPKDSQKHREFESRGYPIQDVSHQYDGCIVVGFPTKQPIVDTMPEDLICTADNTKPEDHFAWLRLLERYWLGGSTRNNQISYTLKYNPKEMSYPEFMEMILKNQPTIKCCAVMPIEDVSAYAYTPEQSVTREKYEELLSLIDVAKEEAYDEEKLECEGGICPIEPKIRDVSHGNSIEAA